MNAINPAIIVIGLILLIPILNKFKVFPMIMVGTTISALSVLILVMPGSMLHVFGLSTVQGYKFLIYAQIVVFAMGEVIWSPRLIEYTASIAPAGREGSYLGLSRIPEFFAKFVNGPLSGYLLIMYCPKLTENCRPPQESLPLPFTQSPEMMWLIYGGLALSSPILVYIFRNVIRPSDPTLHDEEETTKETTEEK